MKIMRNTVGGHFMGHEPMQYLIRSLTWLTTLYGNGEILQIKQLRWIYSVRSKLQSLSFLNNMLVCAAYIQGGPKRKPPSFFNNDRFSKFFHGHSRKFAIKLLLKIHHSSNASLHYTLWSIYARENSTIFLAIWRFGCFLLLFLLPCALVQKMGLCELFC